MDAKLQRLYGAIGGYTAHSRNDSRRMTEAARAASIAAVNARLLADIDEHEPGLPDEERSKRLAAARSAYYRALRVGRVK